MKRVLWKHERAVGQCADITAPEVLWSSRESIFIARMSCFDPPGPRYVFRQLSRFYFQLCFSLKPTMSHITWLFDFAPRTSMYLESLPIYIEYALVMHCYASRSVDKEQNNDILLPRYTYNEDIARRHRGKRACRLTLLHRSYPIPSLRNSEHDRAAVLEVRKRNNSSLQGALSWGSDAQQLACQTCAIFP